jgi:hypothetical protein
MVDGPHRAHHDRGGMPTDQPLEIVERPVEDWELLTEGLNAALGKAGLRNMHEFRREVEAIPPDRYATLRYYERWCISVEELLVQKGVLAREDIDARARLIEERWCDDAGAA